MFSRKIRLSHTYRSVQHDYDQQLGMVSCLCCLYLINASVVIAISMLLLLLYYNTSCKMNCRLVDEGHSPRKQVRQHLFCVI